MMKIIAHDEKAMAELGYIEKPKKTEAAKKVEKPAESKVRKPEENK